MKNRSIGSDEMHDSRLIERSGIQNRLVPPRLSLPPFPPACPPISRNVTNRSRCYRQGSRSPVNFRLAPVSFRASPCTKRGTAAVTRRLSLISVVQRERPSRTGVAALSVSCRRSWMRNLSNFRTGEQSGAPLGELKEGRGERLPRPRPRQLVKYACDRRRGARAR